MDKAEGQIEFALESLVMNFPHTLLLWKQHWAETEVHYRNAPYNPDLKQFTALEQSGMSRYFTARVDGKLVGHLYFIVYNNRHTSTKIAVEDFYFFEEAHRKGANAIKLLRFAIDALRAEGVTQIGMSSKLTGKKNIDPILKRVGFRHVANFFVL